MNETTRGSTRGRGGCRRRIGSLVTVESGPVHVRIDGPEDAAETIVLLHGICASLHWWDRVVPLLNDRYRLVRIDLLGHGCSAESCGGYSPEVQARMVDEVLTEIEAKGTTVVGHSMGAAIAVALAERSSRVSRLVLVNEGPAYAVNSFPRSNQVLMLPIVGDVLTRRPPEALTRIGLAAGFARGFRQRTAFDDPAQPVIDALVPHAVFRGALHAKRRYTDVHPLDERVRDLGLPTLVIWGSQDRLWQTEPCVERYADVPGVRVEIIAGAGHTPPVETPGEVARLVAGFVDPQE